MTDNLFGDIKWMQRAISLAALGKGLTSPNPLVGAVILDRYGNLISEGFHYKSGSPHAEAMAFHNLKKDPNGGTIYVNLEPCCHYGKTPPCVDQIISSGIKKVFVSIKDPDKRVSGKGIKILQNAGIHVNVGLCKTQAEEINKSFIHKHLTGKSYGVLKWAMSIDGRVGLRNGESKWITNKNSRSFVHAYRSKFDAIIVGGNTLRKDNPLLTTRGHKEPEPLRVVFTRTLDLPEKSHLWNSELAKTLLVYDASKANEKYLKRIPKNVDIEKVSSDNPALVSKLLAKKGCNNILWECGPNLATSAIKNGCVQELMSFIAPKILGGSSSMNPLTDFKFKNMNEVLKLYFSEINLIGSDVCIKSKI